MDGEQMEIVERGVLTASDQAWELAVRRAQVIGRLARTDVVGLEAANEATAELGVARRQVYVLLRRWREVEGEVSDPVPRWSSGGGGAVAAPYSVGTVIRGAGGRVGRWRSDPSPAGDPAHARALHSDDATTATHAAVDTRRDNGEVAQREDGWPVTCSNCGASRDGLDNGVPCSSCGSTAKTVHVSLHDEASATESFGITATYEKQRPWSEKWEEVEAAYQALKRVYRGRVPSGASEEWKSIALSFFRACHELPEAIAGDGRVSVATTRTIRRAADRRAALRLIADVDNTRKHGGRDPNKCHAHLGEISWGDHVTPSRRALRRSCLSDGSDGQVARYPFAARPRPVERAVLCALGDSHRPGRRAGVRQRSPEN